MNAKKTEKKDKKLILLTIKACRKASHSQLTEFVKTILGEMSVESFIIEEEINDKNQILGENFFKNLYYPVRKKNIQLSVLDNYSIGEYELEGSINSVAIQNKTGIYPEEEKRFWAALDVLTVNTKLGKKLFGYELQENKIYFLHVKRSSKKIFTVRLAYEHENKKWGYRERDFFHPASWGNKGDIFLFLVPKKSLSDNK